MIDKKTSDYYDEAKNPLACTRVPKRVQFLALQEEENKSVKGDNQAPKVIIENQKKWNKSKDIEEGKSISQH